MAEDYGEGTAFYEEHRKAWGIFTKWGLRLSVVSALIVIFAFWAES